MKPVGSTLEREADRLRHERVEPAVERAREAIEDVPEAAGRAAERVRGLLETEGRGAASRLTEEGRDLAERFESYLRGDDQQESRWKPRLAWSLAAFALGFLAGWLVARSGSDDDDGDGEDIDLTPAPAGNDVVGRDATKRAGEPVR